MTKAADPKADECICIEVPKALFDRVEDHCNAKGISPDEFIFDAISEKLFSIHRERRRKPRL